jgi:hypothetical protein
MSSAANLLNQRSDKSERPKLENQIKDAEHHQQADQEHDPDDPTDNLDHTTSAKTNYHNDVGGSLAVPNLRAFGALPCDSSGGKDVVPNLQTRDVVSFQ